MLCHAELNSKSDRICQNFQNLNNFNSFVSNRPKPFISLKLFDTYMYCWSEVNKLKTKQTKIKHNKNPDTIYYDQYLNIILW